MSDELNRPLKYDKALEYYGQFKVEVCSVGALGIESCDKSEDIFFPRGCLMDICDFINARQEQIKQLKAKLRSFLEALEFQRIDEILEDATPEDFSKLGIAFAAEAKKLKAENEQKDARIKALEAELKSVKSENCQS